MDDRLAGPPELAVAPGLLVKRWDGETGVAYAPATARTHWVSAEAAELLLSLAAGHPSTADEDTVEALLAAGLLLRTA